jgi:hypothetical protein
MNSTKYQEKNMKRLKAFILIAISSITLVACRFSDARPSSAPGIVPTAVAERQSNTETTDVDSNAEGSTSEEFAEPSFANGANGLFIGHSFFIPVAKVFDRIASQSDFPAHQAELIFSAGQSGSPGKMWENEKNRQQAEAILANGDIDLFGMPIATTPDEEKALGDYQQWIDLALTHNPNTSFYIGQIWTPRGPSMEDQKYADLTEQSAQRNFEIIEELRAIYPNNQIYFINYGKITADMKFAFSAGELPDIEQLVGKDETALFVDDKIGHGGRLMHELCALTWVNILYDAEIDTIVHSSFSEEALKILIEAIEYNSQFK